ncbi:MAG: adenine nucleotide alpha hydrolase family protein [Anaerolineales bacterium]|nr:MAG: adenine nucleotide alpha hydrolase family protein [Anaerolineales bacterium]
MFTMEDHILVAVSGGKDSLALWDVLRQQGYQADGLYIDLGIDGGFGYSARSREKVEAFAAQYPEARLIIVSIPQQYGESVNAVAYRKQRRDRICSVCGLIKRHEMNRIALEQGYDVLATGHNLDDEVAVLFGNVLHWQMGYLLRQSPVLEADEEGLSRKVKPFCHFYERETAAYTLLRGIDYIYEECPFAFGATSLRNKDTLTRMEHDAPGTKMHFYTNFLKAKEAGIFSAAPVTLHEMQVCPRCGQTTTADGLCAFCRLWDGDGGASAKVPQ